MNVLNVLLILVILLTPELLQYNIYDSEIRSPFTHTLMYTYVFFFCRNLFALPKWVRDGCAEEKRVMCEATSVFLT